MSTRAPVRRSLLRKITWLGGDRRLVGFAGLLLICVGITIFKGFGFLWGLPIVVPGVFFIAILWVARAANVSDPWMIDIVLRQFKYRKYYAPHPDIGKEHPPVRDFT